MRRIEALGVRPLRKIGAFVKQVGCGDIVHAGVAKYVSRGIEDRNTPTRFADYSAEFTLEHDLSA